MKEIKEHFKTENYECNLYVKEKSIEIGLLGEDSLTKDDILEFYSFDEPKELLEYLRKIRFDIAVNYHLSFFINELTSVLYKHRLC
jgi:hypothetical protein